jgi:multicomponent Na+:H+ antiporter subunit D
VLIAAGAIVSLLTLYALVRVWNMAFWRSKAEVAEYESPLLTNISEAPFAKKTAKKLSIPPLMLGATGAMVAVSIALTVFAGPLYGISSRAGENLEGPSFYVDTIFPNGIPTVGTGETGRN